MLRSEAFGARRATMSLLAVTVPLTAADALLKMGP